MFKNPVMLLALALTAFTAVWGIVDSAGLSDYASNNVKTMFNSRDWFVMLTASTILILSLYLAFSKYGRIKLGRDDDVPEFSTASWLTMMFAAGMGVGLLFYGAAEPITHALFISQEVDPRTAATLALLVTDFHWGLHAWAIYGLTACIIAYFSFRRDTAQVMSAPVKSVFGSNVWTRSVGALIDLCAIYAIAIGLAGSVAMGVFQVQDGVGALIKQDQMGMTSGLIIFGILVLAYIIPLTMDLSRGMALLSNTAVILTVSLMIFVLLAGPTAFLMGGIVESIGGYFSKVLPQGFQTYTFFDEKVDNWFNDWTLNYMVWWLAWAPFVGVFIARISRGRTIREFILGVLFAPTFFSIFWFGIMGGIAFYKGYINQLDPMIVETNINRTTFILLETLPLGNLTICATIAAAFLFIVTSVVSAAYVLAMFSTGGGQEPPVKIKLVWGFILGVLGLAMILSNSVAAVRQVIAMSANPFVFIILLLIVCFFKALKQEKV